ncbi:uncharacterized protein THITE_2118032 [Thermothielavioides terrestris NRRL 8126]|uniref:Uncharacterized protein n=1 Tax=Thermothielavioides terrestris (strain ATCC 38088 / NRRL 8126) TaxID=578455 RepID=G2R6J9_THETT|nr:uncharacterized protein THITE_2118032 [Thermothielavioides terrestris NRRL 8126]AEO68480.1 hypothetical protein THITE_2118032 [Thermothielavioides terrestris NRRL 8126]
MSPLPPSPQSPPSSKALSEERTKAPKVILDRLLALSNDLVIEGEVTPVQAWNRMQREPLFGRLRLGDLRSLANQLLETVKCHGYGAVLRGDVFEHVLRQALAAAESRNA